MVKFARARTVAVESYGRREIFWTSFTHRTLMHAQGAKLANLRLQLLQVNSRRDFLMAAILLGGLRQHHQQRRRTMWVKPWLSWRVILGHYDTPTVRFKILEMHRVTYTRHRDTRYGARTAPLAPAQRPYRHRTISVRVKCGCSREISHRRRTVS